MTAQHDEEIGEELQPTEELLDPETPQGTESPGLRPELSSLTRMYQTWFLDYASYVILERAVPHIDDGLKPVQRRLLHSMKEMDRGKLIKVANIVGETMKYHPHGDASIKDALVQLGQKGFLIDTQGNWGNILTGDSAAAGRYIEAKLSAFALEAAFSDRVTEWKKSYDGTTDEPVALPVKFPLLLAQGAEGIAVGLSSKILSHNFTELAEAACAYLRGESFTLYPDFATGGLIDVSRYNDGERGGSLRSRAKIDKIDAKTLSITELPAGKTTTSLIESILKAVEKGKIRIRRVDDMTAAGTDIRLSLAAGVSSDKAIDALYAFTDCEVSISPNCCVISDEKPLFTSVSQLLRYSVDRTKQLFTEELQILLGERQEQYLAASLERIFIEERIYKDREFEDAESEALALAHVARRLEPFAEQLLRPITEADLKRLLEIRMARILRFNLPRHEAAMLQLQEEIDRLKYDLGHMTEYTIRWYEHLIARRFKSFSTIEAAKVAELDAKLYINREEGFVGTALKDGEFVCNCSTMDELIIFFRSGRYSVFKVEDKKFYGHEEVIHVARYQRGDERTIYNVVYRDGKAGAVYAKRFNVLSVIRDRSYDLSRGKEGSRILYFSANANGEAEKVSIKLKIRNARQRLFQFEKDFSELPIKSRSSVGFLVTKAEVHSVTLLSKGYSTLGGRDVWFDRDVLRLNYNGQGEYLGSFHAHDRILIILDSGECYTTDFSDSIHIEENLMRIEKHRPQKIWTAVYYDAEQRLQYIKRFSIEPEAKREQIVGEDTRNKLLLLTDTYYPILEYGRKEKGGELKLTTLEVEDFALVKSIRARGKRLAPQLVDELRELEPLKPSPSFDDEPEEGNADEADAPSEEAQLFAETDFTPSPEPRDED